MSSLPGIVPLYTAAEMRTVDRLTVEEIGIPATVLMERAGLGAAAEIAGTFPDAHRIAVVCGVGNNGGDGFVVARHLASTGRQVHILLAEPESKVRRETKVNLEVARNLGIPVQRINTTAWKRELSEYNLIIDAMLGTGASGAPRPNMEVVIRAIEASGAPVVALDIPTGVDASTGQIETLAVRADLTLTFHGPKVGLAIAPGRFHAGRVIAVDIGIPTTIEEPTEHAIATHELVAVIPPRTREGDKYAAGTVVAVGGSTGMSGAIALAAQAALRAGAGVVWGVVPEPLALQLDAEIPEVQFRGAIADNDGLLTVAAVQRLEPLVERADCIALGPGLGRSDQTRALARWAVKSADKLVLDADGLWAFDGELTALQARGDRPTLLTPHAAELARLLGSTTEDVQARRLEAVREATMQSGCTVLLKGEDTIVCNQDGSFLVCRSDNVAATAGTGDVLTGVAAALLARGLSPHLAGTCAALACAEAAGMAGGAYGSTGVVASDLLARLPRALQPAGSE